MRTSIDAMKSLSSLLMLLVMLTTGAADKIKFAWDANPASQQVSHYKLHWGGSPGTYTNSVTVTNIPPVANPRAVVGGLPPKALLYFAATANRGTNQSGYSNEVQFRTGAPDAPAQLRITVEVVLEINP